MASSLRLEVVPSPNKKGFAVRCLVDGAELAAMQGAIGADPDHLLWPPESPRLAAVDSPREVVIGLCECGVPSCGDLTVAIERRGDTVLWRDPEGSEHVFAAADYDAELARAVADRRWETPDRTAARLVRASVPVAALARDRLAFMWTSIHLRAATFTISLALDGDGNDPYQLLVHLPWPAGTSTDDIAARALALLATPPRDWPDVEWSPMRTGGTPKPPRLAGPNWRAFGQ